MKQVLLFSPTGSIHSRFNIANIKAINELGFNLHLLANFENGPGPERNNEEFAKKCIEQGIPIHNMTFARGGAIKNIAIIKQLKNFLRKEKFDIVHAHTETGGLLLRLASSVKGTSQFVYTAHGMSFWKGCPLKNKIVYKNIERWICRGMDMNLGMNQEEVDILRKWNSKTASYVHGIGLNLERFKKIGRSREDVRSEFGLKDDDKFIVSVGELDDNKNHATVIKALALLNNRDYKYVICGVGPNKEKLQWLAHKNSIEDRVVLAGYRTDIPDVLKTADIFVFPSFHEGMPVSALEAMAAGLPIVCSKIRGNVDIVKNEENGYLFEPCDENTLSGLMKILLDDKDKRISMGQKNKELVKPFSLDNVKNELIDIYKELV